MNADHRASLQRCLQSRASRRTPLRLAISLAAAVRRLPAAAESSAHRPRRAMGTQRAKAGPPPSSGCREREKDLGRRREGWDGWRRDGMGRDRVINAGRPNNLSTCDIRHPYASALIHDAACNVTMTAGTVADSTNAS